MSNLIREGFQNLELENNHGKVPGWMAVALIMSACAGSPSPRQTETTRPAATYTTTPTTEATQTATATVEPTKAPLVDTPVAMVNADPTFGWGEVLQGLNVATGGPVSEGEGFRTTDYDVLVISLNYDSLGKLDVPKSIVTIDEANKERNVALVKANKIPISEAGTLNPVDRLSKDELAEALRNPPEGRQIDSIVKVGQIISNTNAGLPADPGDWVFGILQHAKLGERYMIQGVIRVVNGTTSLTRVWTRESGKKGIFDQYWDVGLNSWKKSPVGTGGEEEQPVVTATAKPTDAPSEVPTVVKTAVISETGEFENGRIDYSKYTQQQLKEIVDHSTRVYTGVNKEPDPLSIETHKTSFGMFIARLMAINLEIPVKTTVSVHMYNLAGERSNEISQLTVYETQIVTVDSSGQLKVAKLILGSLDDEVSICWGETTSSSCKIYPIEEVGNALAKPMSQHQFDVSYNVSSPDLWPKNDPSKPWIPALRTIVEEYGSNVNADENGKVVINNGTTIAVGAQFYK